MGVIVRSDRRLPLTAQRADTRCASNTRSTISWLQSNWWASTGWKLSGTKAAAVPVPPRAAKPPRIVGRVTAAFVAQTTLVLEDPEQR